MATKNGEHLGRIVVAIDGSASSVQALHWAVRQAELTGSTVEAVTTWEWPTNYGWAYPLPDNYNPAADAEKMLKGTLEPIQAAHPDVTLRWTVVEGHPAPVLVDSSKGADLLVVGSRGHGEFTGMLIGSVSEHCVANAHCPVLVIRGSK